MARIPRDTIDRIRDSADILDVVSDYVELKRRGKNFFGLCPFHTEKTPSFSIAPDKQIYHCFGCGSGGNVITFLMEYEKIEFIEAIKKLGERYSIEIKYDEDDKSKQFFTRLYEIHQLAADHFQKNLYSSTGEKVLKYLADRKLTEDTIKQFSIGYAEDSWDRLLSLIKTKKYPDDVINKSGLFSRTEKGIFDRFRGRIMFPITDMSGKVVAFGGRDFTGKSDAKYLNSSETPIYYKSNLLFGLSTTKEAIRKEKYLIIVEGYMDFLQLYQNEIYNIVAISGTALTERHVNQIRKFTDTVYLAYDGDDPGRKAAIRAGYQLLRGGISPQIIPVPEESDPDSWVKEKGPKPLLQSVKKAKELTSFHMEHCGLDLSRPSHRSQLAKEIISEIVNIRDEILRRYTVKQISEELSVDEDSLLRILSAQDRKRKLRKTAEKPELAVIPFTSSAEKAQFELVKLITSEELEIISFVKQYINLNSFTNNLLKNLTNALLTQYEKDGSFNFSRIIDIYQKKSDRDLVSRILLESSSHSDAKEVAVDCLITLEQYPIKQSISEQRLRLRELEKNGQDSLSTISKVVELQEQLKNLDSKRTELLNNI